MANNQALEDLCKSVGRNPRPADFDQYWRDALAELNGTQAHLSVTPAKFSVPNAACFDLAFTGVRGARLYAKYLRPVNTAEPHPAVVMFHGYGGNSGDWFDKLPYVLAGFSVFALDVRGQGGASSEGTIAAGPSKMGQIVRGLEDSKESLFYRHVFLDAVQLARIAMDMPEVNPAKVYVTGRSQGGALSIVCAALEPRVAKVAAVYPFLCDYQQVWELGAGGTAYGELYEYFRRRDPLHQRQNEVFERLGYIDVQNFASRVRAPLLMATGLSDEVCPPSTQFAAYNKVPGEKRVLLYPEFGHEDIYGLPDEIIQFFLEESVPTRRDN